jgi:hypothetical protein
MESSILLIMLMSLAVARYVSTSPFSSATEDGLERTGNRSPFDHWPRSSISCSSGSSLLCFGIRLRVDYLANCQSANNHRNSQYNLPPQRVTNMALDMDGYGERKIVTHAGGCCFVGNRKSGVWTLVIQSPYLWTHETQEGACWRS